MQYAPGSTTNQSGFIRQGMTDPLTGKSLRIFRHDSGLVVKFLPRPGFSRKFAAVTVPYGSIHTTFKAKSKVWNVPAGSAHFLEHCIFSRDDDGGLLGRLAGLGASANAYTSHTHTLYYFSSVHHFEQALEIYLKAILDPYLETDRVDLERPVIQAELDQYQDDPDSRCYNSLLECLYSSHPVRGDIGGTRDSVGKITSEDLKAVWRHFYQPERMVLTLSGDIEENEVLIHLNRILHDRRGDLTRTALSDLLNVLPDEQPLPASPGCVLKMDVKTPSFLVGIKDPSVLPGHALTGRALAMRQRGAKLYLDTLLSPASPLYDQLFRSGLINDSFGFHYSCEGSYAFLVCGGESNQPEEAASAVRDGLVRHFAEDVDDELFEIQKRAAAGDFVRSLDSVEHSGMVEAQCSLIGIDLFDYPEIYDMIDCATARNMMLFLQDPASYATAILLPSGGDKTDEF